MTVTPKDDMFKLHRQLFRIVENLLAVGYMTEQDADAYIRHNVLPMHIHKNKDEHRTAINLLADALDVAAKKASDAHHEAKAEKLPAVAESNLPEFAQGKVSQRPAPVAVVGKERPVPLATSKEDFAEGETTQSS